jgi:preprotein translocase subunit SecG
MEAAMRCLFAIILLIVALLLVAVVLLVRPAWSATTSCMTYQEQTLGRLQTLCDDGTRAVRTWNTILSRWERTVTPPPGKTCTGRLNPKTRQWRRVVDES